MRYGRWRDVTHARCKLDVVNARLSDDAGPAGDATGATGVRASGDHGNPALAKALLAELRATLAEHDVRCELRHDLAALAVRAQATDHGVWVFVGFGSRYFSWSDAEFQHPVFDMKGAARRIATQVKNSPERARNNKKPDKTVGLSVSTPKEGRRDE